MARVMRRLSGIFIFLVGAFDWIGRGLLAQDIGNGRLVDFVRAVTDLIPAQLTPFLILIGVALFAWDAFDRKRGTDSNRAALASNAPDQRIVVAPQQPVRETMAQHVEVTTSAGNPERRVFVGPSITPEYLVGLFEGHTDIHASKMVAPFLGKWMTVDGPLNDVRAHRDNTFSASFARDKGRPYWTFMEFDAEWFDRLQMLRPNDRLTVTGQLDLIRGHDIQLVHCELVKASSG
jgi:hypothetical protein